MRYRSNITVVASLLMLLSAFTRPAVAADPPGPRATIEAVIGRAISILRDSKLTTAQRREQVMQLADSCMNFEVMARLAMGRYWKDLTEAQRTRYVASFKTHVVNTYRHTTDSYTDEDVKITGDRKEADGDWTILTSITGTKDNKPGQELAKVDYRLRLKDNQWKVIDMTIEGVSLVQNFRSQFQEIMGNGGIDQLLQLLNEKNAANEK